jgi:predicted HTH transcriptional regulator
VAAFLNSEGGFLLIGVKDDKTILGLDGDFSNVGKPTTEKIITDAFQLHFGNIIENFLGAENGPRVTMRFAEKEGKTVAIAIIQKKAPRNFI